MAGRGPAPKPATQRRRPNSTTKTLTLVATKPREVTLAPLIDWHLQTQTWWANFWNSPMASEVDPSDVDELTMLARLVDDFWCAESPSARKELAVEIRLQSARFGKTPIDRARLRWEIDRGDEAATRVAHRRSVDRSAAADPRRKGS
jgi:hypothetical protein